MSARSLPVLYFAGNSAMRSCSCGGGGSGCGGDELLTRPQSGDDAVLESFTQDWLQAPGTVLLLDFLIQLADEFLVITMNLLCLTLVIKSSDKLSGGSVIGARGLSQHFLPQAEVRSPWDSFLTPPAISKQQSVPRRRSSQRL